MTSPVDRDLLDRAARALRDDAAAEPRAVSASWRAMDGWRDVSRAVRRMARRRRLGVILALQIAVAVLGVGAWAAVSGRLPPLFSRAVPAARPAAAAAPAHVRASRGRHDTPPAIAQLPDPPPAAPALPANPAPLALAAADPLPRAPMPAHLTPRASPPVAAPEATAPRDTSAEDIYARAHEAQFALHDYAAALALWDAYLATTGGSLGLEARWNRAIALVRLGRRQPAIAALKLFAAGESDGYRQEEAQALLRALEASP